MSLLEVKPGDSVLETSVGTGLNFKYLPRGVKLSGLDLSAEMLANCQSQPAPLADGRRPLSGQCREPALRRFQLRCCLSRAAASTSSTTAPRPIREMIRVAKPGSLLMIADETEEYVKSNL